MRILVSGASGLVGGALVPRLCTSNHKVHFLRRGKRPDASAEEIYWDPTVGFPNEERALLEGINAVFHLAGEPVLGLWTKKKKRAIRDSRVGPTTVLSQTLASLHTKPRAMICASAIGYYGSRGDEALTEKSPAGNNFLGSVCQEWEAACEPARAAGIRVANVRVGIVLSERGGALKSMLPAFRMGVGGPLGDGSQYLSWITLDDLIEALVYSVENENISGPVNGTAPNPITNFDFTKALGRAVHRPTMFRVPAALLRLVGGGAADEMLLASARVYPERLEAEGFVFRHPEINGALAATLG
ncbi:hypothetical protein BH09SUM1_BH09SUM1_23350 [soil metagenome]